MPLGFSSGRPLTPLSVATSAFSPAITCRRTSFSASSRSARASSSPRGRPERLIRFEADMAETGRVRADPAQPRQLTSARPFAPRTFCRFKGMTREELIAPVHEHLQRVEAESRDLFERNRASLTPERPQATTEIRVRYGDGVVGWQLWTDIAIFDEAGRVVEYQCVGRDTTEQHNARAALEASEARYRGVVEAQNDLITRVRPDGRATFVNDA